MIHEFKPVTDGLLELIPVWEKKLLELSAEAILLPRNIQNRNIKQIVGHMVDSVSNNIHRVVHLQYQESPFHFPNYATYGNNDKWIEIQNYENEDWENLVKMWKYMHLHFIHIIKNVKAEKLDQRWIADPSGKAISLKEMVVDFIRHFKLHINEIEALI